MWHLEDYNKCYLKSFEDYGSLFKNTNRKTTCPFIAKECGMALCTLEI